MKKSKVIMFKMMLIIVGVCFLVIGVNAQTDTRYTLYNFNKMAINPAYAGGEEVLTFSGHYRNQWTGLEGAPKTYTVAAHAPFFDHRVGAGMSIIADKIGIVDVYSVDLSYAYRIKIEKGKTLSIGMSGQIQYSQADWGSTTPLDEGDIAIPEMKQSKLNPNFGVGVYLQTSDYYLGASIPRIFRTTAYDDYKIDYQGISKLRSYYLMGGLVHRMSANVKLQPGILLSYIPNAPFEMDVNANVIFYDKLLFGLSYRLQNSINTMIQMKVSEQLKIAAAVDLAINELRQYAPASFEVMMEYQMIKVSKQTPNIRYFF